MTEPIAVEEPRLEQARPAFPRIRDVAPSATYPYVDEDGRELFVVCRYQTSDRDKTFRQFRLEAGEWVALGDARRVIYRLPHVLEHIARNDPRPIVIAEGERDVEAIEQAGGVATCNPMGAGKWTDDYSDMLQGARNVIIVADRDDPGRAHALKVRSSLATVGVAARIVEARSGKDARDHLEAGHSLDAFAEWSEAEPQSVPRTPWLVDAADLLAEPDPGPTRWLVESLIVDHAIIAAVGRWKTTKSYALLDVCVAIATGESAFGRYKIPEPGPVVFVNEESGRDALRRRVDALCRGRGIDPGRLRGRLLLAANARIRLDDADWQNDVVDTCQELRPRLIVFDPLARMKAPLRDENAQTDMAPLLDFLRLLRDAADTAVCFVHHTGHNGEHMRGSSDLESFWESRLSWERDGQSSIVKLTAEHREAEAAEPLHYTIAYDPDERSMRFTDTGGAAPTSGPTLAQRILDDLRDNGPGTTDEVRQRVGARASDLRRVLDTLSQTGTVSHTPSEYADAKGRRRTHHVWNLSNQAVLDPTITRPNNGTTWDDEANGHRTPSQAVPTAPYRGAGGGRDEAPDDKPEEHEIPWRIT